ncbi:hypothetical protein LINGRAHAP2_LOCUS19222 [Linum grandiflorum]
MLVSCSRENAEEEDEEEEEDAENSQHKESMFAVKKNIEATTDHMDKITMESGMELRVFSYRIEVRFRSSLDSVMRYV